MTALDGFKYQFLILHHHRSILVTLPHPDNTTGEYILILEVVITTFG